MTESEIRRELQGTLDDMDTDKKGTTESQIRTELQGTVDDMYACGQKRYDRE